LSAERPDNVTLVRRSYEAFARGDLAGVLAAFHADIEWEQAQGLPHGGSYSGRDEVERAIFAPLAEEWWDNFEATPTQLLDAGDDVVVLGRYTALAKRTRKRLDVPFVHVWSLRDGQAVRFRQFLDTAGWMEALG
jgi:uncharacterized protein